MRLSVKNVSAGYGNKIVVKDVSFEIPPGRFCVLLGLNGSGKTTLLKAILGLIPIKSGSYFVDDIDCTKLSEYKRARHISYIPQRHSKLLGVSVMDAVMMGFYSALGPLEFPTAKNRQAAVDALEKTGLGHLANEDFSRLSEGQKQMVILTRTLVQNTPVMLMDEPDGALDFINRRRMLSEVKKQIHTEKKAGLVTLHDPGLAIRYCDHLFLFNDGKIVDELDLSRANLRDIEKCLSQIYGDISIIEHEKKYLVVP